MRTQTQKSLGEFPKLAFWVAALVLAVVVFILNALQAVLSQV
jgi:hypothetical protein